MSDVVSKKNIILKINDKIIQTKAIYNNDIYTFTIDNSITKINPKENYIIKDNNDIKINLDFNNKIIFYNIKNNNLTLKTKIKVLKLKNENNEYIINYQIEKDIFKIYLKVEE